MFTGGCGKAVATLLLFLVVVNKVFADGCCWLLQCCFTTRALDVPLDEAALNEVVVSADNIDEVTFKDVA